LRLFCHSLFHARMLHALCRSWFPNLRTQLVCLHTIEPTLPSSRSLSCAISSHLMRMSISDACFQAAALARTCELPTAWTQDLLLTSSVQAFRGIHPPSSHHQATNVPAYVSEHPPHFRAPYYLVQIPQCLAEAVSVTHSPI